MVRYFMSYATANDTDFFADFMNFRRISTFDPGVPKVDLSIVISEVRPVSEHDRRVAEKLAELAERNPRVHCGLLKFKSNVGRDFSSAATSLAYMAKNGEDSDYALFVNRSGYGPFSSQWYSAYLELMNETGAVLVGSTINGKGHPQGKIRGPAPHVQTYCYLSKLGTLRPLLDHYPAQDVVDRVELIEKGEIGLSSWVIKNGHSIACLAWPNLSFDGNTTNSNELFLGDVKKETHGLPFLYKRNLRWQILGKILFELWRPK